VAIHGASGPVLRIQTLGPNVASLAEFAIYLWRNPRNTRVFPIALGSRMFLIPNLVLFAARPRPKRIREDRAKHGKTFITKAELGPDRRVAGFERVDRRFIRHPDEAYSLHTLWIGDRLKTIGDSSAGGRPN
jgi:hypothetical protein